MDMRVLTCACVCMHAQAYTRIHMPGDEPRLERSSEARCKAGGTPPAPAPPQKHEQGYPEKERTPLPQTCFLLEKAAIRGSGESRGSEREPGGVPL